MTERQPGRLPLFDFMRLVTVFFLRFLMLCVRRLRRRGFLFSDHLFRACHLYSACLTCAVRVYRRASDNLIERGESAVNCLFSPLPTVFSRALFSTTLPTLGENGRAEQFPRFQPPDWFFTVLCSIVEACNLWVYAKGGWGRRKAGDWGRKPGRGSGIAAGLPPFPRVVSPRHW